MSQPYPVPIPIPQPKSRPLPDSRGIPDTLNLFFFGKNIGVFIQALEKSFSSVYQAYQKRLLPTRDKGLHLFSKLYQQISKAYKNYNLTLKNQKFFTSCVLK